MLRKCSKCLRALDESNFNWKIKGVKLQYHCKDCSRRYIRNHYNNNVQYYVLKARKRNDWIKKRAYSFIGPYLLTHPCVDCGERDILVLEFDHKDRRMKLGTINNIIQKGGPLESVIKEIEKCDVRCANCHRRKTEKEIYSWKLKYAPVA